MVGPGRAIRSIFATGRGYRTLVTNLLAAFGLLSGIVQFVGELFPDKMDSRALVTAVTLVACVIWGILRAYPPHRVQRSFTQPAVSIVVEVGDLFAHDEHIVVGFTDTFDTSISGHKVISPHSVQGQLVRRRYDGNHRVLDRELKLALRGVRPVRVENRGEKRLGKLDRYEIGTVAVVGPPLRLVFGVAYSRMSNELISQSTTRDLWLSLDRLWDAVFERAQHGRVAMPIVGSGLARLDSVDRNNLLSLILLSFMARSRRSVVCRELRIVIRPSDLDRINMPEIAAFLRTL